MNSAEARDVVRATLQTIAPEADLDSIDTHAQLHEELDLDSINFLDLVAGIFEETGIDIPERDYPQVATFDDLVTYLERTSETASYK